MENLNFSGCEALTLNEAIAINGGDAYSLGYEIGSAIHDFCVGFWDGLCGK